VDHLAVACDDVVLVGEDRVAAGAAVDDIALAVADVDDVVPCTRIDLVGAWAAAITTGGGSGVFSTSHQRG
jgi:hypothetical protein